MEDQGFWGTMRKIIREELAAAIKDYLPQLPAPEGERMVSTAELCRELKMSKQTLYNWLKKPFLRSNVSSRALCIGQGRCVLRSDILLDKRNVFLLEAQNN
jgi:hypothetical protein